MIVYDKLFPLLKAKRITTYKIRKDNIIPQNSLTAINHNRSVTIDTINRLCAALDCQPGDILEYIPDPPEPEPETRTGEDRTE